MLYLKKAFVGLSLILCITLVFLIFLNFFLDIFNLVPGLLPEDAYFKSGIFKNETYAKELEDETLTRKLIYEPFTHWRVTPFQGHYVNVDSTGLRAGVFNSTLTDAKEIFFFGGSTAWGTGAEDKDTISSGLAQLLNKETPAKIINYGQPGFFSTQEIIELIKELRKGHIPKIALFYDGINDSYVSGYDPADPARTMFIFNNWNNEHIILLNWLSKCKLTSSLYEFIMHWSEHFSRTDNEALWSKDEVSQRAERVIEAYKKNTELIRKLSEAYHFKVIFYWQPYLLAGTKKNMSPAESESLISQKNLTAVSRASYALFEKTKWPSDERNISHIFDDISEPVYLDYCHIGARGNALVAREIAKDIKL